MRTYLIGYNNNRVMLDVLTTRQTWARLDAEMRRRLLAMFDAAQDAGTDLGLGQGWRSSTQQEQTFRARHTQVASGGCCAFDGRRWQLIPGMAHAAPPGISYHESTTVDGFALAADLVGDLNWAMTNCGRFGLLHFKDINREPWHYQPVEIAVSRARYDGQPLPVWSLSEEVDMIVMDYLPGTPQWIATLWTGATLGWIVDGHADAVLRAGQVKRVTVTKEQFAGVIKSSKCVTEPPTGMPTDLRNLWKAAQ